MKEVQELCAQVRQTAYDLHVYHGPGHLEKVYENALAHRLRKAGLNVLVPRSRSLCTAISQNHRVLRRFFNAEAAKDSKEERGADFLCGLCETLCGLCVKVTTAGYLIAAWPRCVL